MTSETGPWPVIDNKYANEAIDKSGLTTSELYDQIHNDPMMHAAFMAGKWAREYKGVEGALRYVIEQLGLDPENQHFARTPERVAKYLKAYVQPVDLGEILADGFLDDDPAETDERHEKTMVVQTDIRFMGICAHHLLPFFGAAAVGYLPTERVVGLSKLTRLVYAAGHQSPTTQEHITNMVADALMRSQIAPKGVAVIAKALHGCMSARGVEAPATYTWTTALRGTFQDVPALESKFTEIALAGLR